MQDSSEDPYAISQEDRHLFIAALDEQEAAGKIAPMSTVTGPSTESDIRTSYHAWVKNHANDIVVDAKSILLTATQATRVRVHFEINRQKSPVADRYWIAGPTTTAYECRSGRKNAIQYWALGLQLWRIQDRRKRTGPRGECAPR
jgi:hypothetical protein